MSTETFQWLVVLELFLIIILLIVPLSRRVR